MERLTDLLRRMTTPLTPSHKTLWSSLQLLDTTSVSWWLMTGEEQLLGEYTELQSRT